MQMTAMKRRKYMTGNKLSEGTYKRCVTWTKLNGKGHDGKQNWTKLRWCCCELWSEMNL